MSLPLAETVGIRFRSPDAIDPRFVFRVYAWIATVSGLYAYLWPLPFHHWAPRLEGMPWGDFALLRTAASVVTAAGLCASALALIDDPRVGRRALMRFAWAHLVLGPMWLIQWSAILSPVVPRAAGWAPMILGVALLYIGLTASAAAPAPQTAIYGPFHDKRAGPVDDVQSQYEEHLRQAVRQEERTRLARDLHDAVKQQLFVIHTAAATADARLETDAGGTRVALEQVRTAAREASVEMQAMIEQLQALPIENIGLAEALKKQSEALGFRSGAKVQVSIGQLPRAETLPPGTQEALFRAAQEALANIGRHARARHLNVGLGMIHGRFELSISDDGIGFDPVRTPRGMGIGNMLARAQALGASFALQSQPGSGTSVRISVPVSSESPWLFGRRALAWTACGAAIYFASLHVGRAAEPFLAIAGAVVGIMALRSIVAFARLRRRRFVT